MLFAAAYVTNFVIAFPHIQQDKYQNSVVALIIMSLSAGMAMITLQQPEKLMVYLEVTGKDILFTFRTKTVADLIIALHIFGYGLAGRIMALITTVFLAASYTLAQKRPDVFRELFRAHDSDPELAEDDGTGYEASNDNEGMVVA